MRVYIKRGAQGYSIAAAKARINGSFVFNVNSPRDGNFRRCLIYIRER